MYPLGVLAMAPDKENKHAVLSNNACCCRLLGSLEGGLPIGLFARRRKQNQTGRPARRRTELGRQETGIPGTGCRLAGPHGEPSGIPEPTTPRGLCTDRVARRGVSHERRICRDGNHSNGRRDRRVSDRDGDARAHRNAPASHRECGRHSTGHSCIVRSWHCARARHRKRPTRCE